MRSTIVTTTIRVPVVLRAYCANLARYGHDDVSFVVVGDRKTPAEASGFLAQLAAETGFEIDYWDVARQAGLLRGIPELDRLLPYDSIQRRNLAYLLSAESGAERIISIDDDNWPTDDDFLGGHSVVGGESEFPAVSSSSGWYNTVELLDVSPARPLYHRGFPTSMRGVGERLTVEPRRGRVVVNAGLWKGDPDVDAISHLDVPAVSYGLRPNVPERVAVAPGTSTVFNTQNTSFLRDVLPCMFLFPMGDPIGEMIAGRHDDVWMSIFLKLAADRMGDLVSVGVPLVEQIRNHHDLFEDALVELPAMRLTNRLVEILVEMRLQGQEYSSCYVDLASRLREGSAGGAFPPGEGAYVLGMADRMESWAEIVAGFMG